MGAPPKRVIVRCQIPGCRHSWFEIKPKKYNPKLVGDKDDRCQDLIVPISRRCRFKAASKPDRPALNLTGFYEQYQEGFKVLEQFTLQINQAGNGVSGWVQEVVIGKERTYRRKKLYFNGFISGGECKVDFFDAAGFVGEGKITKVSGSEHDLKLVSSVRLGRARLTGRLRKRAGPVRMSQETLDNFYVDESIPLEHRDLIRATMDAPIPSYLERWLTPRVVEERYRYETPTYRSQGKQIKKPNSIYAFVKEALNETHVIWRVRRLEDLNEYLRDYLLWDGEADPDSNKPKGWHPDHLPLVKAHLRLLCNMTLLQHGKPIFHAKTVYPLSHWIQKLLNGSLRYINDTTTYTYLGEDGLGLYLPTKKDLDKKTYRYQMEVEFHEAVLFFWGKVTIRAVGSKKQAKPWEFKIKFLGLGGVQVKKGRAKSQVMEAPFEWSESDFIGPCSYIGFGAGGGPKAPKGAPPGKTDRGGSAITTAGSKLNPSLSFVFDEDLFSVAFSIQPGGGPKGAPTPGGLPGVRLGVALWGKLYNPEKALIIDEHSLPKPPTLSRAQVARRIEGDQEFDFALGCSQLQPSSRDVIRSLCSRELFFMISDKTKLSLKGFTDTNDCKERNVKLARFRCENVLLAMEDVLGSKFKRENVTIDPIGEEQAARSIPQKTKAEEWRQVELELNGHRVITLVGWGAKKGKAKS